jgi:uncharacterized protein YdeI (BOF family)
MKKIGYILLFLLLPLITSAQYAVFGNDPATVTTQRYILNSPGNTPGNRRNIEIVKDSFYIQQWSWRTMFLSLSTSVPYTTSVDRIVVADDSGYVYPRLLSTIVDTATNLASKTWVSTRGYLTSQVNADWNAVSGVAQILNKPTIPAAQVNSDWAAVSGVAQILNKPTIPAAQVNTDWNAVSGITQILNKPNYLDTTTNLASKTWVSTRGYLTSQVNADWNAVSGVAQILNKPTIPASQVNSDWNAVSGVAQILNKPTIPAAQVNTDWNAVSGITQILNKPNYLDTTTNLASKTWVSTRGYLTSQVNADWNAVSGAAQILNKPTIPAAQVNSDWSAVSGVAQILNKPTIPAAQVNTDWNAVSGITQILNKPSYLDTTTNLASKTWVSTRGYLTSQVNADWNAVSGAAQILNKPTIPAAQVNSDWNAVSGVAQILNKPTLTNGTVTSVGLSSTDLSVSGSPVTTSGSITVNLNTSGVTAGTYDFVTVNNKGIVTAGSSSTGMTAVTRPINSTAYTISSTRPSTATYYIRISCTATIGSASSGSVTMQYSIDGGTNWLPAGIVENSNTVTLAVVLNSVTVNTMPLTWDFPANALVRMVSATTGTTTITYVNGGERAL